MTTQRIKFYQTGTYTAGNRLLDEDARTVQSRMDRTNSLNSGHRACQGCGEALGARYAIDAAMRASKNQLIAINATGCLEVFSSPYPESAWQIPWMHSLFGNAPAVAAGVAAANLITVAGDGTNKLVDGDGSDDGIHRFNFHRFLGDFNGDGRVDVAGDMVLFNTHYISVIGSARYDAIFDFDGNGRIDALDLAADEQARLYYRTALQWLGLPESRFANDQRP